MTLPAPVLDDRRFQDIVDEAKRQIPTYCPQWTDHNVADPGIALLELFAWMSEMVLYRVNQVPDRLYVKFLELIGVELYPPSPARTRLLFELAAPAQEPVRVPAGTQVATGGSDEHPVVFMTDTEVQAVRPVLSSALTRTAAGRYVDVWNGLRTGSEPVECFPSLQAGDAVYLGFEESLAGNLVRLDVTIDGSPHGTGIRPEDPPREWQAWDGADWRPVRLLSDSTDGLDSDGSVLGLVGPRHEPMPLGTTRAHWLRCRLMSLRAGQRGYDASPRLRRVVPVGLGVSAPAHHAEPAPAELVGVSTGRPGQVFTVRRAPVLVRRADERVRTVVRTRAADGSGEVTEEWLDWDEVPDFTETGPDALAYVWSSTTGEIRFAPHVRQPAPSPDEPADEREASPVDRFGVRRYGAVPPMDAQVWVTGYRYGGGHRGNVGARTLTALRTTVPSVKQVYNLDAASGGVDAETVENAKVRGPLELRGGNRAVTAADFERITLQAARGVARARCLPPSGAGEPVRVLVVPRAHAEPELLELVDLDLDTATEEHVRASLDAVRMLTMQVVVDRPRYLGISVSARVRAAPTMRLETVKAGCESALYRYINPVVGGPDGHGWPFGRNLHVGEIFGLLSGVQGVQGVVEVVFSSADLGQERGSDRVKNDRLGNVVALPEGTLFASCDHVVLPVQ